MSTRTAVKVIAVIAIAVALLVPLIMIRGVVNERARYRQEARDDVAESWTGAQDLLGPVLRIPLLPTEASADGAELPAHYLLPDDLRIEATLRVESRKRGLYSVPVYITKLVIDGSFDLGSLPQADPQEPCFDLGPAELAIAVSDNRGFTGTPALLWDGQSSEVLPGTGAAQLSNGVHANVGMLAVGREDRVPFRIEFELRGMDRLTFAPIGRQTHVDLSASWPHPSFTGRFLPIEHEIRSDGFHAKWSVSHLASGAGEIPATLSDRERTRLFADNFGVALFEPIDIYQQTTRSVKYGNMFIVVTFTAFFLVEIVRKLMLHPMQYLLVGLALVIFFLLLLSLSEHMAFGLAYLIAAAACIGLIGVYMSAVLKKRSNGLGVVSVLAVLYGMLYGILKSEDIALVMGSILLFALLAVVMLVTRKLDWYTLAGDPPSATEAAGDLAGSA